MRDGKCVSVTLKNVPAFAFALDAALDLEGHGSITIDISYGGMIYAIVDAAALGFEIVRRMRPASSRCWVSRSEQRLASSIP